MNIWKSGMVANMQPLLFPDEHIDILSQGGFKIIQNKKCFCFGCDAVFLSEFVQVRNNENVCDLGTGNAILPLLLYAKNPNAHFTGIEIQERIFSMANRTVELNELSEKIKIIKGDMKNVLSFLKKNTFSCVVSNPPYMTHKMGNVCVAEEKSIARCEILCNIEDVVKSASDLLNSNGRFYLIHRPSRLEDVFFALKKYNLVVKRMQFIYPKITQKSTMVMIEARKSANPGLILEKPIIMYS